MLKRADLPQASWIVAAAPLPSREWQRGQLVRIRCGPLAGRFGVVSRMEGRHRVRLFVDLFRGETRVSIEVADLA
jgi:transcription antitermination factor NusG